MFAAAVNDAGTRLNSRQDTSVDLLAWRLFEWGGGKDLDTTFRFVYPFIGGTAVAHSFNLADPSVGRVEWEDTVTHTNLGIVGDGISGVGKTNVTLAGGTQADAFVSFGAYSRTANAGVYCELGNYTTGGFLIYSRYTDGREVIYMGGTGMGLAVANSQGLFSGLRTTAASAYIYRNGVLITSSVANTNIAVDPPVPFLILAYYDPIADPDLGAFKAFSNRNLAFAFLTNAANTPGIGAIFSTAKQAELYSYVQTFQTRLLRQV